MDFAAINVHVAFGSFNNTPSLDPIRFLNMDLGVSYAEREDTLDPSVRVEEPLMDGMSQKFDSVSCNLYRAAPNLDLLPREQLNLAVRSQELQVSPRPLRTPITYQSSS
jgi:hypothetical protein